MILIILDVYGCLWVWISFILKSTWIHFKPTVWFIFKLVNYPAAPACSQGLWPWHHFLSQELTRISKVWLLIFISAAKWQEKRERRSEEEVTWQQLTDGRMGAGIRGREAERGGAQSFFISCDSTNNNRSFISVTRHRFRGLYPRMSLNYQNSSNTLVSPPLHFFCWSSQNSLQVILIKQPQQRWIHPEPKSRQARHLLKNPVNKQMFAGVVLVPFFYASFSISRSADIYN